MSVRASVLRVVHMRHVRPPTQLISGLLMVSAVLYNAWLMIAVIHLMTRSVNLWAGLAERFQELLLAARTLMFATSLARTGQRRPRTP